MTRYILLYRYQTITSRGYCFRGIITTIIFRSAWHTKCERTSGMGCHMARKIF